MSAVSSKEHKQVAVVVVVGLFACCSVLDLEVLEWLDANLWSSSDIELSLVW
jgi:hypothetical protein